MKLSPRRHPRPVMVTIATVLSAGLATASAGSRPYLQVLGPSALRFEMFIRPTFAHAMINPSKPDSSGKAERKSSERAKLPQSSPTLDEATSPVLPNASSNVLDLGAGPLFPGFDSTAVLEFPARPPEEESIQNVIPPPEKAAAAIPTRAFIQFFNKRGPADSSTNRNDSSIKLAVPFSFEPPSGSESRPSSSAEFRKE